MVVPDFIFEKKAVFNDGTNTRNINIHCSASQSQRDALNETLTFLNNILQGN